MESYYGRVENDSFVICFLRPVEPAESYSKSMSLASAIFNGIELKNYESVSIYTMKSDERQTTQYFNFAVQNVAINLFFGYTFRG